MPVAKKLREARDVVESAIVDAIEAAESCNRDCDHCVASACKSWARIKAQKLAEIRNAMTQIIDQIETGHYDLDEEDCNAN